METNTISFIVPLHIVALLLSGSLGLSPGQYLVHDGGRRWLDAWLLVRERKLLQQVHVGQGILQGHVGSHGDTGSLTKQPSLKHSDSVLNIQRRLTPASTGSMPKLFKLNTSLKGKWLFWGFSIINHLVLLRTGKYILNINLFKQNCLKQDIKKSIL